MLETSIIAVAPVTWMIQVVLTAYLRKGVTLNVLMVATAFSMQPRAPDLNLLELQSMDRQEIINTQGV